MCLLQCLMLDPIVIDYQHEFVTNFVILHCRLQIKMSEIGDA